MQSDSTAPVAPLHIVDVTVTSCGSVNACEIPGRSIDHLPPDARRHLLDTVGQHANPKTLAVDLFAGAPGFSAVFERVFGSAPTLGIRTVEAKDRPQG